MKTVPKILEIWVVVVAHRIFVSAQVPLGLIRVLNWVGLGWGWA